jgi:glycosyltransferase involved in cell wall biosynthesis
MPRVLFVTAGLGRGGAEVFLVRLARRLASRGHVCAVASLGSNGPMAGDLAASGIPVSELGRGVASPSWRLARCARAFRPDVVQGWMYRANLAACLAARAATPRAALLWSVRQGLNDLEISPWLTRMTIAWNARWSRLPFAIVYNAKSAARQHEASGFLTSRTRVVPNGIDVSSSLPDADARARIRASLGVPDRAFVVGFFARWHPVKNHRGFVDAAALFARRHEGARFLLAGAGVDAANASLVSWLTKAGISQSCVLLGERSDVSDLLAAADIATLASLGEALPNSILEAMAAGVPCVAPDVGDIAELIGNTGVVVPAGDVTALAAGWERFAAMAASERRLLGEQARERVADRYSLLRAVAAFEALYLEAHRGRELVGDRSGEPTAKG